MFPALDPAAPQVRPSNVEASFSHQGTALTLKTEIDTGAVRLNAISLKKARALGLDIKPLPQKLRNEFKEIYKGVIEEEELFKQFLLGIATVDEVTIPTVDHCAARNVEFLVLPMLPGGRVDALLGVKFLGAVNAIIAYPERDKMSLKCSPEPRKEAFPIAKTLKEGMPHLLLSIGGHFKKVSIDTGSPTWIAVPPATAQKWNLPKATKEPKIRILGWKATYTADSVTILSPEGEALGCPSLKDVPVQEIGSPLWPDMIGSYLMHDLGMILSISGDRFSVKCDKAAVQKFIAHEGNVLQALLIMGLIGVGIYFILKSK